jgi:hypothetical protein
MCVYIYIIFKILLIIELKPTSQLFSKQWDRSYTCVLKLMVDGSDLFCCFINGAFFSQLENG